MNLVRVVQGEGEGERLDMVPFFSMKLTDLFSLPLVLLLGFPFLSWKVGGFIISKIHLSRWLGMGWSLGPFQLLETASKINMPTKIMVVSFIHP